MGIEHLTGEDCFGYLQSVSIWQRVWFKAIDVLELTQIWWQARRREVMRQQRIEEEAVTDAAEREYQVLQLLLELYGGRYVAAVHDQQEHSLQDRKNKLAREEEERTAKRRAKRQKKKVWLACTFCHQAVS